MILMILTRLLEAVKVAIRFSVQRPKDALIILMVLLLIFLGWRLKRERGHSQELAAKIEGLPPGTQQIVTIYEDRVITKTRNGPNKIEYRDRYLPPEGHVEMTTREKEPQKPPELVIKDHGLTRHLGGGFVYSGGLLPEVDLKFAYWGRYSTLVGLTPSFGGLGISRHIDDLSPFGNLEILGLGGISWRGDMRFGLGIRINF